MAGHNKWSKVKHKKAAIDAQKSKIFSKLAKVIAAESKNAGGDVNSPGLRAAIEQAKAANMPNDNIDRAVKKGTGADASQMEYVQYEAYGPGGTAIIIEGLTDNRNRTAAEMKHLLSKLGANFAEPGAASWAFTKEQDGWTPQTTIPLSETDAQSLERIVSELEDHDDVQNVYTNAE